MTRRERRDFTDEFKTQMVQLYVRRIGVFSVELEFDFSDNK